MEISQIKQLPISVNNRLRRRTVIAVFVVVGSIVAITLWSNHKVNKTSEKYETYRVVGESLAHAERQLILDKVTNMEGLLQKHTGIFSVDINTAKELDTLFLRNLQEQKK